MWLVGVVVRRYIDFLILLIPTPLVSALVCSTSLLLDHFLTLTGRRALVINFTCDVMHTPTSFQRTAIIACLA